MRLLVDGWRTADLELRLSRILEFAEKLTLRPASMLEEDIGLLRSAGLHDRAVLEVVEVTAYFNFVNRLADALGVSLERPGQEGWPTHP